MKIGSVDVIEVSDNGGIMHFGKNDIVKVVYSLNKTCTGRITFIGRTNFEMDASKEYKSAIRDIKYDDIKSIKLIKRQQIILLNTKKL